MKFVFGFVSLDICKCLNIYLVEFIEVLEIK